MGIKKMLNKRKEEKQRRMLKQKTDKELVKRAETVAEEHPETAKTLLENVGPYHKYKNIWIQNTLQK